MANMISENINKNISYPKKNQFSRTNGMEQQFTFSSILRLKLDVVNNLIEKNTRSPESRTARNWYKEFLIISHSIIRASVPLMSAALKRCDDFEDDDTILKLKEYYSKHIIEETDHDKWLLDDLSSIGVTHFQTLEQKPHLIVAELVGSQYYWIMHWHPITLLGYISYLEGYPPSKEYVSHLMDITRYPKEAFRTLMKHSNLDPFHSSELNELLDNLRLSPDQAKWIASNALYTANKLVELWTSARSIKILD
jgi:hypothetical protein